MISARLLLHGCAFVLPLLPTLVWLAAMDKQFDQAGAVATASIGGPAVLAAQTAVCLRWRALDRRAFARQSAWPTGLLMGLLTHLFFGFYLAIALVVTVGFQELRGETGYWQVPMQALFLGFFSLLFGGALSLPVAAWVAHVISRRREKELAVESH